MYFISVKLRIRHTSTCVCKKPIKSNEPGIFRFFLYVDLGLIKS